MLGSTGWRLLLDLGGDCDRRGWIAARLYRHVSWRRRQLQKVLASSYPFGLLRIESGWGLFHRSITLVRRKANYMSPKMQSAIPPEQDAANSSVAKRQPRTYGRTVIRQSCLAMAALVWLIPGPASYAQSLDPHKPAGCNKSRELPSGYSPPKLERASASHSEISTPGLS